MRVLIHTLSGWVTYAMLRATQLGVGRRQVLLLVGSLAFLTFGVAVFRAGKLSTAPPGLPHVTMDLAPTPAEVRASTRPSEPEPPPVVPTGDDLRPAEPAADL